MPAVQTTAACGLDCVEWLDLQAQPLVIRPQSAGGVLIGHAKRCVMLNACSHHSSPRYLSLQFGNLLSEVEGETCSEFAV